MSDASESLRSAVIQRAGEQCEYYLLVDAANSTFYREPVVAGLATEL